MLSVSESERAAHTVDTEQTATHRVDIGKGTTPEQSDSRYGLQPVL